MTVKGRQNSNTAAINVSLTIAIPSGIEVTNNQDLNFGSMLATSAHNVVVGHDGTRNGNASYLINDSANPYQAGVFTISNQSSSAKTVQISLPSSTSITNGSRSMTISNFTSNQSLDSNINIPSGASITVNVGATLAVTAGVPAGEYTGTYTVTIDY